jgi:hypothetical protein
MPSRFATGLMNILMIVIGQYGCLPRFAPARGESLANTQSSAFLYGVILYHANTSSIMKSSRGTVFCDASVFTFPLTMSTTDRVTLICLQAKSKSPHRSPISSPH